MPWHDQTPHFRQAVKQLGGDGDFSSVRHPVASDQSTEMSKQFIIEAYNILNHIQALAKTLNSIRKPYLDVTSRQLPSTFSLPRSTSLVETDHTWANRRQLTNEERDQIDAQSKSILRNCADRVKEMEAMEKRRSDLVASNLNPIVRFLPSRLRHSEIEASSEFVAAHHSSITWYLRRRLAELSQSQKEMQEERIKRQNERSRTLGSGVAHDMSIVRPGQGSPLTTQEFGSRVELPDASPGGSNNLSTTKPGTSPSLRLPAYDDEDDTELEITQSQALQFEQENAEMLKAVEDTLDAVRQAEARLLDISALQTELVTQLTRQTELTDQLFEDAIATTSMVEKGNIQLRQAKRRAKDGRLFILVFLLGASFSLLFLHYY